MNDHPTPEDHNDGYAYERWTYIGRRLSPRGKPMLVWLDTDGEKHWFALTGRIKMPVVGGVYQLPVNRQPDGGGLRSRLSQAEFQEVHHDNVHIGRWQTADLTAATELARIRLEASARRRNALDEALAPVLDIATGLRSYADKETLARYAARRIHQT